MELLQHPSSVDLNDASQQYRYLVFFVSSFKFHILIMQKGPSLLSALSEAALSGVILSATSLLPGTPMRRL